MTVHVGPYKGHPPRENHRFCFSRKRQPLWTGTIVPDQIKGTVF
jgi:hypothetical protein